MKRPDVVDRTLQRTASRRRPLCGLVRRLLAVLTLTTVFSGAAASELRTEIVELGYVSADDVVPVLAPLVSPPGSVSGLNTTLIVRASPAELEDILGVIQHLDRAPRNLMITVSHGIDDRHRRSAQQGSLVVGESGVSGSYWVYDSRSATDGSDTQQVRVLEGRPAFIHFGEAVPVAARSAIVFGDTLVVEQGVEYIDVGSGFYAVPRLQGDRVTVAISPERSRLDAAGGGVINTQSATTTVSGRLGEWLPLGSQSNVATRESGGALYSTRAYDASSHTISIKVDRVD